MGRFSTYLCFVSFLIAACTVSHKENATDPAASEAARLAARAGACAPPQWFRWRFDEMKVLSVTDKAVILKVRSPAVGRAVASYRFRVRHIDADPAEGWIDNGRIYGWSGSIDVGKPFHHSGYGDDLCPGSLTKEVKGMLGQGTLSEENPWVTVRLNAYISGVRHPSLKQLGGAHLDLWVESSEPGCEGKSIQFQDLTRHLVPPANAPSVASWKSTLATRWPGFTPIFLPLSEEKKQMILAQGLTLPRFEGRFGLLWPVSTTNPLYKMDVPAQSSPQVVHVIAALEGTPLRNPNQNCAVEGPGKLTSRLRLDGEEIDTSTQFIPVTQSMGHLVENLNRFNFLLGKGAHQFSIELGAFDVPEGSAFYERVGSPSGAVVQNPVPAWYTQVLSGANVGDVALGVILTGSREPQTPKLFTAP